MAHIYFVSETAAPKQARTPAGVLYVTEECDAVAERLGHAIRMNGSLVLLTMPVTGTSPLPVWVNPLHVGSVTD